MMLKEKRGWLFVMMIITLMAIAVIMILGRGGKERLENPGDIICERVKEEIPVNDISISNNGESFLIEASSGKEEIFSFLEKKLGETGRKLRMAEPFMPEEIRLRCEVSLLRDKEGKGLKPTITHMSLNEYEIPAPFLENIVDFPLISGRV